MLNTKKQLILIFCILFLLNIQNIYSQYFIRSYDMPAYSTKTDIGRSVEPLYPSPNWTVAGFTNSSSGFGGYDWNFTKVNSLGFVICNTLLGFAYDDSCFSHVRLPNTSRVVLAGFYRPYTNLKEKASWTMLDTTCAYPMTRVISDTARHQYRSVTRDNSNNFILTGFIETAFSPTNKDKILAAKYTSSGALVWANRYIVTSYPWVNEKAYSICYQPTDGSYVITGVTDRFSGPGGPFKVFVMKITSAGAPVWYLGYSLVPGAVHESRKIIPMTDGGFVICGWSNAFDPSARDYWVFRITSSGAPVWSMTYGLPGVTEEAHSIVYESGDATLDYTGFTTVGGTEDIIIAKISAATGAPVWTKKYPNASGSDRGYDIKLIPGTVSPLGYAVTGQIYASSSASLDEAFMKTNSLGLIPTTNCIDSLPVQPRPMITVEQCARIPLQLSDMTLSPGIANPTPMVKDLCVMTGVDPTQNNSPDEFALKQNYPNPFNPNTVIEFSLPVDANVTIKLYNTSGELVATLKDEFTRKGSHSIQFEGKDLSSGVYFYTMTAGNFTETKKLMLVK